MACLCAVLPVRTCLPEEEEQDMSPGAVIKRALRKPIAVEFDDTPVLDAVSLIRQMAEFNLVVDAAAVGEKARVTLKAANKPLATVLPTALSQAKLTYAVESEAIYVSSPARIKVGATVHPPLPAHAAKLAKGNVSVELVGLPVTEAVAFLSKLTNIPMSMSKSTVLDEKATVHIQANAMRCQNALAWVLRAGGLTYKPRKDGGLLIVNR
jgi:type II secretory pathway component GspD/PulD (secretin)